MTENHNITGHQCYWEKCCLHCQGHCIWDCVMRKLTIV